MCFFFEIQAFMSGRKIQKISPLCPDYIRHTPFPPTFVRIVHQASKIAQIVRITQSGFKKSPRAVRKWFTEPSTQRRFAYGYTDSKGSSLERVKPSIIRPTPHAREAQLEQTAVPFLSHFTWLLLSSMRPSGISLHYPFQFLFKLR